jgi:hypothetical protein
VGAAVLKTMVCGSTTFTSTIGLVKVAKDDGLLGRPGRACSVNTTSSAVKGEPSWKRTFLRSLNSHVRSSSAFHDVARPGTSFWFASRLTSGSKMWSSRLLLGDRLWKWGRST